MHILWFDPYFEDFSLAQKALADDNSYFNLEWSNTSDPLSFEGVRKYDLIIFDPSINPVQSPEIVKNLIELYQIPVFVLTHINSVPMAVQLLKAGAVDYQLKSPQSFAELSKTLTALLKPVNATLNKNIPSEAIQNAIFQISEATLLAQDLDSFFQLVHKMVARFMPVHNFYIALYNEKTDGLTFPYYIDETDDAPPDKEYSFEELGKSLTYTLIRRQQPMLLSGEDLKQLIKSGEIDQVGTLATFWLGIPLKISEKIIGALVVQTYTPGVIYDEHDKELLTFVSTQIALAIERKQNLLALKESTERYQSFFEQSHEGMILVDEYGIIIEWNDAIETLTGLKRQEALGQPRWKILLELLPSEKQTPDRVAATRNNSLHYHKTGEITWSLDAASLTIRRKNNELRYLQQVLFPIHTSKGHMLGIIMRDITERRLADEELRAERRLFIGGPTVIFKWKATPNYPIEYVSPNLTDQFGYELQDFSNGVLNYFDIVHPEDCERVKTDIEMFTRKGQQCFEHEYRIRRLDGEYRWIYGFTTIVRNTSGHVTHYHGYVEDITERKIAQQATVENESRFRALFEQSPDSLFQIANQKIIDVNPGASRLLGYDREEFLGRDLREFVIYPAAETPDSQKVIEAYAVHKTGAKIPVEVSISKVTGLSSDLVLSIVRDVTERKRAEANIALQLQKLAVLRTVEMSITSTIDLSFILQVLLDQVTVQLNVDAADVYLINIHTHCMEFASHRGFRNSPNPDSQCDMYDSLAGRAAIERRMIAIPNLYEYPNAYGQMPNLEGEELTAYYAFPLIAKGSVKGVLELFHRHPLELTPEWLDFIEALGGQAALAIDNATLFEDLQRANARMTLAYDATIEGWSRALEIRDRETQGHCQRVKDMTLRLARAMGINDEELVHIRRGAFLHDIGKMGIPDNILLKPGPLTDEEKSIMQQHPFYAFQLLAPIEFLRQAIDIPYSHHERWDGTGYPRKLKGVEIPLSARIFAIVDVWDALSYDRPYRKAWNPSDIRDYIRQQSGSHFDPRIVEAFIDLLSGKNNF
jgi:PAS domain S-box-containing protein